MSRRLASPYLRAFAVTAVAALLATLPGTATATARTASEGSVTADELLASVRHCTRISDGLYRSDESTPADIPVCGTRDAVFWTADMDIDCDGQYSASCNDETDPNFQPQTAFAQSDGEYLSSEGLPFVVVPMASELWDFSSSGIRGGSVVAVVHRGRVLYAVVGDTGPSEIIGEASYAAAERLGIAPGPEGGGTDSEVTYIAFRGSEVSPIESHEAAVTLGERLAREFVVRQEGSGDRDEGED
ncbi:glycoside hydrolase family 75 protein [Streptomyces sp. NPDC127084]|uniref:glycoside hydrolase family 75 protein n=1 Tax=Streptomyces sp. NPDC127084 TaxID=3347133 RepID=UPI0036471CA6